MTKKLVNNIVFLTFSLSVSSTFPANLGDFRLSATVWYSSFMRPCRSRTWFQKSASATSLKYDVHETLLTVTQYRAIWLQWHFSDFSISNIIVKFSCLQWHSISHSLTVTLFGRSRGCHCNRLLLYSNHCNWNMYVLYYYYHDAQSEQDGDDVNPHGVKLACEDSCWHWQHFDAYHVGFMRTKTSVECEMQSHLHFGEGRAWLSEIVLLNLLPPPALTCTSSLYGGYTWHVPRSEHHIALPTQLDCR